MRNIEIIQKLNTMHTACESELLQLITTYDEKDFEYGIKNIENGVTFYFIANEKK